MDFVDHSFTSRVHTQEPRLHDLVFRSWEQAFNEDKRVTYGILKKINAHVQLTTIHAGVF